MTEQLATTPIAPPAAAGRLRSLDGLRGVAALIVVLHHCMLTWQPMASTYGAKPIGSAQMFSTLWWLTQTPLKLLTAGTEAVIIFFVLSGVVLALPVLRVAAFDWWAYYPRRLVRLYVPVIAAVVFAFTLEWIIPATANTTGSWWIVSATYAHPGPRLFIYGIDPLAGNPLVDNPLWSLRWEILFSLLLPAIVALAIVARSRVGVAITVVGAGFVIALGVPAQDQAFLYLPVFVVGVAIAVGITTLREHAERLSKSSRGWLWWTLILIGALLAIINSWLLRPIIGSSTIVSAVGAAVTMLGAVVLVIVAAFWRPVIAFLTARVVQWLGRISFSLYLIHFPIIVVYNAYLGPRLWWLSAMLTVVTSLGLAELFARFVEQPAHRLSQRTGRAFSARVRAALPGDQAD